MIYIILTLLIIHLLFYKPSNTMACGLFGWIGDDKSKFNTNAFTILGLYNQERGTDAVGILSTTSSVKSILNSKFNKFIENDIDYKKILNKKTKFVIGHTRNSSPGTARTLENAQPVAYVTKTENKYGLIHNGNIKNTAELLKELNLKKTGLSDSYDMAEILYSSHPEEYPIILKKYIGKAALVWIDRFNQDITYMFRGESLNTSTVAISSEERPLYYIIEKKNSVYFSSLKESLTAAFSNKKEKIEELKTNSLYIFENGAIKEIIEVDRSLSYQAEGYVYKNNHNQGMNHSSYYDQDYYDGSYPSSKDYYGSTGKTFSKSKLTSENNILNHISLKNGLYVGPNNKVLTGEYGVTRFGRLITKGDNGKSADFFKTEFFRGSIISRYNITGFNKNKIDIEAIFEDVKNASNNYLTKKKLSSFTITPVIEPLTVDVVSTAFFEEKFFDDKYFHYPYTTLVASFIKGSLRSVKNSNSLKYRPITYDIGSRVIPLEFEKLCENSEKILISKSASNKLSIIPKKGKMITLKAAQPKDKAEAEEEPFTIEFVEEILDNQFEDLIDDVKTTLLNLDNCKEVLKGIEQSFEFIKDPTMINISPQFDFTDFYKEKHKNYKKRIEQVINTLAKIQ